MVNGFENNHSVSENNPCVVCHEKSDNFKGMSRMHCHPYYEIYFLISGNIKYYFHNRVFALKPGNVIIIKPYEMHRTVAAENSGNYRRERYTLNIDEATLSKILRYNRSINLFSKKGVVLLKKEILPEIIKLLSAIENEEKRNNIMFVPSVRNYSERILMELCVQGKDVPYEQQSCKDDIRIRETVEYIIKNYNKNISLKDCTEICFMSTSNFTKVFHKAVGMNFKSYINSVRTEKACEMLTKSDLPISEIAEKTGFDSHSYFTDVFKKNVGVSPSAFRLSKAESTNKQ